MSTNKEKKVFILAGEPSGDYIGSSLINGLRLLDKKMIFFGIGGPLMLKEGLVSKYDMNNFNIIGFLNYIKNYKKLKNLLDQIVKLIMLEKPEAVITIDTKGFSFLLAKNLKKSFKVSDFKCPLIHFVPPTIWAYGKSRAKKWKNLHDNLFCLFKKEEEIFHNLGIECVYLGNPVIEKFLKSTNSNSKINHNKNNLIRGKTIKCFLLPGSRDTEIRYLLPEFISLIKKFNDKQISISWVIPTTKFHFKEVSNKIKNLKPENDIQVFILEDNYELLKEADIAIACSGTITLELALFKIPTIAVYKTDIISASIGRMLVNFKNVILPNFLVGENFVPFLFQEKCTVNNIYKLLRTYIDKIKEKKHLFTINSDKIVKSMNYSDINQFNFSKNSGKKIIEIINSYKY